MRKSLFSLFLALNLAVISQAVAADNCAAVINGQGSTLLAPYVEANATAFNNTNPGYTVTYNTDPTHTGSGNGISQLQAGATFFGGTDVPPTCAQQTFVPGNRILTFPVAIAGVAVGYNNSGVMQGNLNLTASQLTGIFTGQIYNWSQLGFASQQITVIVRSDSSGDTGDFTTYLNSAVGPSGSPYAWNYDNTTIFPGQPGGPAAIHPVPSGSAIIIGANGNGGVAAAILANPGAIGYLSYGFAVSNSISTASLPNATNGVAIFPTVTSIGLAAYGVCVPFDLNMNTIFSPTIGAYPIASPTNLIAYEYQPSGCDACEVANWLYYMGTTAQQTASSFNLAPITLAMQEQYINNLNFIKDIGDNTFTPRDCFSEHSDSSDNDCGRGVIVNVVNNNKNFVVNANENTNSDEVDNENSNNAEAAALAQAQVEKNKYHKYYQRRENSANKDLKKDQKKDLKKRH